MEYSEYEKIKKQAHRQRTTSGCLVRRRDIKRWGSGRCKFPLKNMLYKMGT